MLRVGDERVPKMLLHDRMKEGSRSQGGFFKTFAQCVRDDLDKFRICAKNARNVVAGEEVWWKRARAAGDWKFEVEAGVEKFVEDWKEHKEDQR